MKPVIVLLSLVMLMAVVTAGFGYDSSTLPKLTPTGQNYSLVNVNNSQFLRGYIPTDFASSIWGYNMSGSSSTNDYNHTITTYNTYGLWWYNQSLSSTITSWLYNQTIGAYNEYGKWWYNMSGSSSVNDYNQTIGTYNQYGLWWYNQSLSSTITSWLYNQSSAANVSIFTTYGTLWYNFSSPVINLYRLTINDSVTGLLDYIKLINSGALAGAEPCITWNNTAGALMTARICSKPGTSYANSMLSFYVSNESKALQTRMTIDVKGNVTVYTNLTVNENIIANGYLYGSLNNSFFPVSLCNATSKVTGINSNGTLSCSTDLGGDFNYNHTTVAITKDALNDQHTHVINNITGTDDNACTGTDKVSNVTLRAGNLQIVCTSDATGAAAAGSNTDIDANISMEYMLFEPFTTNGAIETGEVGIYGWNYVGTATSVTPSMGNHPGTIRLSTGTVAGGNSTIDLGITTMMIDTYTGNISFEWLINVSHSPTYAENFSIKIGLHDETGNVLLKPTDGIYFLSNSSQPNWTASTMSNNVLTQNISLVPPNAQWQKLRADIQNISGVYRVSFYVNNNLIGIQGQTTLPIGTTRAFGPVISLRKTGGTTARTVDIDYFYLKQTFAVAR